MPPNTKTNLISIHIINQVISDRHTKTSQLWSLPWNQVNSDHPHWNQVYFDHPHNKQVNFDANTRTMSLSGRVAFACYTYQYMFLWCSSSTYNIITSTNSNCSWRFHTTVKPRKYCVSIPGISIFFCFMVYTRLCVILRYVPFLLYVVYFKVSYIGRESY